MTNSINKEEIWAAPIQIIQIVLKWLTIIQLSRQMMMKFLTMEMVQTVLIIENIKYQQRHVTLLCLRIAYCKKTALLRTYKNFQTSIWSHLCMISNQWMKQQNIIWVCLRITSLVVRDFQLDKVRENLELRKMIIVHI